MSGQTIAIVFALSAAIFGAYSLAIGDWQLGCWQLGAGLWAFNAFIAERFP